jgi:hypothetical protein
MAEIVLGVANVNLISHNSLKVINLTPWFVVICIDRFGEVLDTKILICGVLKLKPLLTLLINANSLNPILVDAVVLLKVRKSNVTKAAAAINTVGAVTPNSVVVEIKPNIMDKMYYF